MTTLDKAQRRLFRAVFAVLRPGPEKASEHTTRNRNLVFWFVLWAKKPVQPGVKDHTKPALRVKASEQRRPVAPGFGLHDPATFSNFPG